MGRLAPGRRGSTGVPPVRDGREKPGRPVCRRPPPDPHPEPEFDEVPSPTKRKTASAAAMTQPISRARSLPGAGPEAGCGCRPGWAWEAGLSRRPAAPVIASVSAPGAAIGQCLVKMSTAMSTKRSVR